MSRGVNVGGSAGGKFGESAGGDAGGSVRQATSKRARVTSQCVPKYRFVPGEATNSSLPYS